MSIRESVARNLAAAFLGGAWSLESLVRRGARALGGRERWLRPLARRVLGAAPCDGEEAVARFIAADRAFRQALEGHYSEPQLHEVFWVTPRMSPAAGAPATWRLPALATTASLAEWLGLTHAELDWFAGVRGRAPAGPLRHYTCRWLAKRSGGARLLEVPKPRLKAVQRKLLHELLAEISTHDAAHGYRRGRSVATYAAAHAGQCLVLRFDLRHFFASVRASRVHALFRAAGYPRGVARLLTGLCTHAVPEDVWRSAPGRREPGEGELFRRPHLPQGAPTSPALANLCAYRLDLRLAALARKAGDRYTRYADDLAFSGGEALERSARRFQVAVCRVALEEDFEVRTRKTRFMRRGVRQQLAGVVVNVRPNVRRDEYDRLKAILHNCARHGPASQNRDGRDDFRGHLAGRVAYVAMLNPGRGRRLRALFDRVTWLPAV